MKRLVPIVLALVFGTGCVVHETRRPGTYVPPPEPTYAPQPYPPEVAPAPLQVWYYGEHWVPEDMGGGWCYLEGSHWHDYYPDRIDWYYVDRGYYVYQGPFEFSFYAGHPLPGGGWCFLSGPHVHGYTPRAGSDFVWRRGQGWVYVGAYRHNRPPPRDYWPAPPPPRPMPRPGPDVRPAPQPSRPPPAPRPYDPRPAPVPAPRPADPRHDERTIPIPAPAPAPAPAPLPGRERPPHPGTSPTPAPAPAPPANPDQPFPVGRDRPGHGADAPGQQPRPLPPVRGGRSGNERIEVETPEARPPVVHEPRPGRPAAGVTPPIRNPETPRSGPVESDRGSRATPAPAPSAAPAPARPAPQTKKEKDDKEKEKEKEKLDARGRVRGETGR